MKSYEIIIDFVWSGLICAALSGGSTGNGAGSRYAIHYVDSKECDDADEEISTYDARCLEIAREMFYLMSQVRRQVRIQVILIS